MAFYDEFEIAARMYDLDTQRHVTSRTYEAFCWEGRFRLLEKAGLGIASLLEDEVRFLPELSHCSFSREQMPGAPLKVRTWMSLRKDRQDWVQDICEMDGKLACRIATTTRTDPPGQDLQNAKWAQLSSSDAHDPEGFIGGLPGDFKAPDNCETVHTRVRVGYSERTPFFDYGPATFWRIIEEGRWGFSDAIGLDQKMIMELDTVTFFTSGTFRIFRQPVAGELLTIHTWVDRLEKIRCFLRSDVVDQSCDSVFSNVEEQLIVSLSRRRPRRAGPDFVHLIEKYLANMPSESS